METSTRFCAEDAKLHFTRSLSTAGLGGSGSRAAAIGGGPRPPCSPPPTRGLPGCRRGTRGTRATRGTRGTVFQVLQEVVADPRVPGREGGASRSDSTDLKIPRLLEVALPCREVPGLCSKAAPGCFGWFGGKLWRLHRLFQMGGPLVANCG
ncbi:unnamed protein product [Nyctereutes procyonoides]|uniref:(raccoon dog) hypothetical protein n=1 Tax=Nyctereutes procyonoides TaxID=34880 RepID=A0A811YG59_NYCPR|nr:unnamed protein product [Nyctereutes procyonoides]